MRLTTQELDKMQSVDIGATNADTLSDVSGMAFQKGLQTDPRYLELDAARRENDMDEELQNMIGEFNLARLDLNNESAKAETDAARVAELNQRVNDLYSQIMASEGMVRYNAAKAECEAMVSHIDAIINTAMNGGDPMTVQAPTGGCTGSCSTCGGCH